MIGAFIVDTCTFSKAYLAQNIQCMLLKIRCMQGDHQALSQHGIGACKVIIKLLASMALVHAR